MTSGQDPAAETPGQALEITRIFDAPRELVFKAWTEAEHLEQWWGAAGSTIQVEKLVLEPGGMFLYSMNTPDGNKMWGKFVYCEISPPERLIYTNAFADEDGNTIRAPFSDTWPLEILNTLIFTENEGRTTVSVTSVPVEPTEPERETFESFVDGVQQGLEGAFEQLDAYLEQVQA